MNISIVIILQYLFLILVIIQFLSNSFPPPLLFSFFW